MRFVAAVCCAVGLSAAAAGARADQLPPAPTQWVTDNAGFLSVSARTQLNDRLSAYSRATGHQVLVWIGDSTGDVPLEDWTIRAFTKWKVGRKGLDDGLVLFIFARDHKLRIEVGYGLEQNVPDVIASRIIRDTIVPLIKSGDNDKAVSAGIDQILAAIGGQPLTFNPPATESRFAAWLPFLLFMVVWVLFIFLAVRSRGHAVWAAYAIGSSLFRGGSGGFSSGGGFSGGGGFGGFSGGGGGGGGGGASGGW